MKTDFLTIRPTRQSFVWNREGDPPAPGFILEWGSSVRPAALELELGPEPADFGSRSTDRCTIPPPPDGAGGVVWQMPPEVWRRLVGNERVYYRAMVRTARGREIHSLRRHPVGEMPFLHGRSSARFYSPCCAFSAMPRVQVAGSAVVREGSDRRFLLRGVNVSGLNHARYFHGPTNRWRDAAQITPELLDRLKGMQVNLIRLPLNQDWLLMGYHEPELPEYHQWRIEDTIRYLEDIDQIIAWAAERCMYVMLALHTLRLFRPPGDASARACDDIEDPLRKRMCAESCKQPYNAHLPDDRSWLFWSVLAQRYRECPNVMFDICNEPHEVRRRGEDRFEYRGVSPPISRLKAAFRFAAHRTWWASEWNKKARELEALIHVLNPGAVVFVSGFGGPVWASSLELMDDVGFSENPNVIFAVHWYWNNGLGRDEWGRHLGIDRGFRHPVFVKEWGVETPEAVTQEQATRDLSVRYKEHWRGRSMPTYETLRIWGEALVTFFADLAEHNGEPHGGDFAGFAAWSTGDKPRIFEREGVDSGPYRPGFPLTDYGRMVQEALARLAEAEGGESHRSD
jgi:hypothetical protein